MSKAVTVWLVAHANNGDIHVFANKPKYMVHPTYDSDDKQWLDPIAGKAANDDDRNSAYYSLASFCNEGFRRHTGMRVSSRRPVQVRLTPLAAGRK